MKKRLKKKLAAAAAAVNDRSTTASAPRPIIAGDQQIQVSHDAQMVMDAFQNLAARLGTNTPSLLEGTSYPNTRLTRNYQLLNSLYRSHWIIRKIIDVPQEDMMKNWIDLVTEADPKYIDKFQKVIRKTQTRAKILKGLKWGRLFGGAAGVMLIEGHEDILDKPLDYDAIMPGSYKGITVVDRWTGVYPSIELVEDISSPDFGLPLKYTVTAGDGKSYSVHSSRVVRFTGRDLPEWESQAEQRWGISEIELVFDELKKRDNTSWNIAALIFLANIRVLKMGDLGQQLATNNAKAQQKLHQTLQAQNQLMNNMGLLALDKEDEFDTKQQSFSGLDGVYQTFMLDIAGCSEMPVTKIFGRSPAGLNATGESDEQNYEDTLTGRKESHLRPVLDKVLPVIAMSTWGEIPDDFDYSFRPSRTLSNKDRTDLADKKGRLILDTYNTGLLEKYEAKQELQALEDESGMFTNITNESIEKAKTEPGPIPGEFDLGPEPGAERTAKPETREPGLDARFENILGSAGLLSPLGDVKKAATDAASSPTEAQKRAGNYKKEHIKLHGLDLSIENPKGSVRSGTGWSQKMQNDYGYIKGTKGKDKDHIDVFIGDCPASELAFVVNQVRQDGTFDEHKVILGTTSEGEARRTYLNNYQKGWTGLGSIETMTMPQLKTWLREQTAANDAAIGWIGVDLDGTLARYTTWKGNKSIGEPIGPMLDFVKDLIADGENVKIFTARADSPEAVAAIKAWLREIGLPELDVTNIKDHDMKALYDDRAFRVKKNTGVVV